MEGSRVRTTKPASAALTLLFLCILGAAATLQEQTCPDGDFLTENGTCCNKCSPGFKLVKECQQTGHRTECAPCPQDQYNEYMNYATTCRRCRTCKKKNHEVEVSACSKYKNTVCGCERTYYKSTISGDTFECLQCKKCGENERQIHSCTSESNTKCECKENYHRVGRNCEPCKTCSPECPQLCSSTPGAPVHTKAPNMGTDFFINLIAGVITVVVVLMFLLVVATYMATKRFTKKKMRNMSSEPRSISQDSCKQVLIVDEEPWSDLRAVPQSPVSDQDQANLPDCVPLEIDIPNLIYTLLDVVPVQQVKQLVRSLGVKDNEIEQVELDHRSCREAHYQMLRLWAERGSHAGRGGRGRMLFRPLLADLLEQLRNIHLGRAAEELEVKYGIV